MLGRLIGAVGRVVVTLALIAVAGWALWVIGEVLIAEGVAGLWHPVVLCKFGELILVGWALRSGRARPEGESPRALRWTVLLAALLSGIAWWQLQGRAPWSWWCLILVVVGLVKLFPREKGVALRHRVGRWAAAGLLGAGYLLAVLLAYTIGTARPWYPVAPALPVPAVDRVERWEQDLDYAVAVLRTLHVDAFHSVSEERLHAVTETLRARLRELDDAMVHRELARLVTMVGDAHTSLSLLQDPDGLRFPIDVRWFGDRLWVVHTADSAHDVLGMELKKVGSAAVSSLRAQMRELVSHEYVTWADRSAARALPFGRVLQALGVISDPSVARFVFVAADGSEVDRTLSSVPMSRLGFRSVRKKLAAFERRDQGPYWFRRLPDGKTFYFRYGKCEQSLGVRSVASELFTALDSVKDARLIIDLRQNTGGSTLPFSYFVTPGLEARSISKTKDRLFVLVDGGTYSSGVGVAAEIRERTEATFVGVPTGGHTNGYGEVRSCALPNSGLRLYYSTRGPDKVQPVGVRVLPDVSIPRTFAQFVKGEDPVLRWVVDQ